jgi:hypothetical protein
MMGGDRRAQEGRDGDGVVEFVHVTVRALVDVSYIADWRCRLWPKFYAAVFLACPTSVEFSNLLADTVNESLRN